jgi:hypothetical protein
MTTATFPSQLTPASPASPQRKVAVLYPRSECGQKTQKMLDPGWSVHALVRHAVHHDSPSLDMFGKSEAVCPYAYEWSTAAWHSMRPLCARNVWHTMLEWLQNSIHGKAKGRSHSILFTQAHHAADHIV